MPASRIQLLIRGICCIIPGIPGKTENIRVTSIIGRFLEHSRVYCFGSGASMKMYIASADLMTRNTERRIEIACPVRDMAIKTQNTWHSSDTAVRKRAVLEAGFGW